MDWLLNSQEEGEEVEEQDPEAAAGGAEVCAALLTRSETNREAMEKGVRAFVSYIRGYKARLSTCHSSIRST